MASIISFVVGVCAAGLATVWLSSRWFERARSAERRALVAERLAEIGSMTAGLAHEIKNPLSTLGLNAQLLDEGLAEAEIEEVEKGRLRRRVGALRREADRLRGILADFLEYAGEIRFESEAVDLNELVGELADFFMPQAEQSGVRLRLTVADVDGPLMVEMDAGHTKQAVLNLMLNAVQAMVGTDVGGDGTGSDRESDRELLLRTTRSMESGGRRVAEIHVTDTGPGIDAERVERIFQPYFSTKPGGTGLGLPTTRRLIEGQGGRLDVHSEVGRGTDFVIVFPEIGEG